MPAPDPGPLLACPRCDQGLTALAGGGWACGPCSTPFPLVGGIPALFAEPAATLGEWRNRQQFAVESHVREAARLQAALSGTALRPLARERLALLQRAHADQATRLQELLAPLGVAQRGGAAYATHLALRTRLPPDQGLTTYFANIHRDWCWGDAENAASCELVAGALGGDAPSPLLVLGAGAGRLAYDLHARLAPGLTIALDFNPLLLLAASRIIAGEPVGLWEFPLAPRSLADQAVLRTLSAPAPAAPGLQLVLGDALRPPFRRASIGAVVTPWLVDIVSEDFQALAGRMNRLLPAGGRWVIFGSLAFGQAEATARYSLEEVLALVMDAGFDEPDVREDELPYLCSPASRHARRETVVTIAATKARDAPAPARHRALPDWLVTGTQPVPLLPSFQEQALSTRIYAFLMGLIDGRRSMKDMARLLVEQRLMTREDAEPAVRGFLLRMYDDAQRDGSGYR
jgi:uncharacterized protein YbaR (Trm112 family)